MWNRCCPLFSFLKFEKMHQIFLIRTNVSIDGIGWYNKWKLNSANAVYTDCTSKTLRVINAKYFWNNWLIAKYTLIDYIANKQVWDKLVELRVTLLNEKVTEILKHKPEELTDTKGFFLHLIWPDVFLQPITL